MWKDIKGFEEAYQISDKGEIRSKDRYTHFKFKDRFYKGTLLRTQRQNNGYKIVKLMKGKRQYTFTVHKLVAEHFLEKPSYAQCVNHKDGNKLNNCVENLEWVTYSENNIHALQTGLRKARVGCNINNKIKVVMFDEENIIAIKESSREMAQFLIDNFKVVGTIDTIARSIRSVCKQNEIGLNNIKSTRRRKKAYGYKFSYLKDYSKPVSTNCKTTIDT